MLGSGALHGRIVICGQIAELTQLSLSGRIKTREEFIDCLERPPEAFAGLFRGETFGRRIVRV